MSRPYLSLSCIRLFEAEARERGVSKVARSPRGFLAAYRRAGGDPKKLPERWRRKREAFIARHEAGRKAGREPLYDASGRPTRRHLAMIV